MLDFHGNPLSDDELPRQKEKLTKSPLLVRGREHLLAGDLIVDAVAVVDPQSPILSKLSCLMDALKMGSSYNFMEKLWVQFVLTAGLVNAEAD